MGKKLSNEIRFLRAQKGRTQVNLAEYTGLGIATIKRIESGYTCDIKTLVKVEKALECEKGKLFKIALEEEGE